MVLLFISISEEENQNIQDVHSSDFDQESPTDIVMSSENIEGMIKALEFNTIDMYR